MFRAKKGGGQVQLFVLGGRKPSKCGLETSFPDLCGGGPRELWEGSQIFPLSLECGKEPAPLACGSTVRSGLGGGMRIARVARQIATISETDATQGLGRQAACVSTEIQERLSQWQGAS